MTTNPNQIQVFITLQDYDTYENIELNPAFIVYMSRKTQDYIPYTMVHLTTGMNLNVRETPEQISQMQMDQISNLMNQVMQNTMTFIEDIELD